MTSRWKTHKKTIKSRIQQRTERILFASRFFVHLQCLILVPNLAAILPILGIAASPKIVPSSINGARAASTDTEVVDCLAFYDVAAFPAADSVVDYHALHHALFSIIRRPADIAAVFRHHKHAVHVATLLDQEAAPHCPF